MIFRGARKRNRIPSGEDWPGSTKSQHYAATHQIALGHLCESFRKGSCQGQRDLRKTNEDLPGAN